MLELQNISYGVEQDGDSKNILRDISLTIDERFVAITGPNGGGKSTLAKVIAGILTPTQGRILLDGSLSDLKACHSARRTIRVAYEGSRLPAFEQIKILKDRDGHAEIALDTAVLSVPEAISLLSSQVEIRDLSVSGESVEELVVSLYQEFAI